MRADRMLVERGLAPTRSAAQRLIAQGAVRWSSALSPQWSQPSKAGDELPEDCEVQITDDAELRWASRAGLKLAGAIEALSADISLPIMGQTVLDVGQSTGGFTDVLLHHGAGHVVGIDVGHGQLLDRLRRDPRVTALEGINARELHRAQLGLAFPETGFGFIVGDLSFISQTLVWPALAPLLARDGMLLMLVKPPFELQPQHIGKGGLVKPNAPLPAMRERLHAAAQACGLSVRRWLDSPVAGGSGNREFFILLQAQP